MKDLHTRISPVRVISPVSVADNTAQVGQIVDMAGFKALEFLILLGSLADADATFVVLVEDGDVSNLSDAVAVDDKYLLGTELQAGFTFAADDTIKKIGYKGHKRYVRLTITPANNASAAFLAVVGVRGGAYNAPTPTL